VTMTARVLNSVQVAALLISASYGIGLLFGSGELALAHRMAGGIYGVATAIGMLVLALFAQRMWSAGIPIWGLFGRAYGPRFQGVVALLSLVWMAGVLAAQIQGGVAVAGLLGLDQRIAPAAVLVLIFGASRLDLQFASRLFALSLLISGLVLVYALVIVKGTDTYLGSVPAFVRDLETFSPMRWMSVMLAVAILVCVGADYQQFVLAAKRPSAAITGCVLAGLGLLLIGFLPPALIVAMSRAGLLDDVGDAKQVVPLALALVAKSIVPGADKVLLAALSAAALGSGAAIVRAMSSALASISPGRRDELHPGFAVVALTLGAVAAAREQGIVDTMVSLNVVYIASIAVVLVMLLRDKPMSVVHAAVTMTAGISVSFAAYVAGWFGRMGDAADAVSLGGGVGASVFVALCMTAGAKFGGRTAGVSNGSSAGGNAPGAVMGTSCLRASRTTNSVISRESGGSTSQ